MTDGRSAFSAFRVKKDTIRLLQNIKQAYELASGRELSNDELIHMMVASIGHGDASVWEIYTRLQATREELEKFAAENRRKQQ